MKNKNNLYKLFNKTYKKSKKTYLKKLENNLQKNIKTFVVTANPEAFMLALNSEEYMNLLLDDITQIVPDGIGLVKAGKIMGYNFKERIPGIEIADSLLSFANKYKKKIYLFGSKKEIIEKMIKLINEKYPNAKLVGAENGYVNNKDEVFEDIKKKSPDVILVALGMPAQETLIYKHINECKKGIFVGVGGSFDVMSGSKKRAPKIFQKLNLEWLYRIIKEPKRLKRFWNNNIKFLGQVIKYK